MKKKNKIIAVLLLIVNTIICFIPGYFYCRMYRYNEWGPIMESKFGCTMFEVKTALHADSNPAYTFACFVLICWLVCIAVMLYSIIRNKEHRLIGCTPMFGMIIFLLFNTYVGTITYPWGDGVGYVDYSSFSSLMSASYGLQMAAAGIWFVSIVPKDELTITFPKSSQIKKSSHMISEADELRKYKELLDMGAITQEEFEAKKKELLNL